MLEKCEFCHDRVRPRQMRAHLKRCPKARRKAKLELNKSITQSIEYRNEKLSQFEITQEYNLKIMTDIQFNDLIDRLTVLKKQREQKEKELSDKAEAKKLKADEQKKNQEQEEKKLEIKKDQEEKDRLEQAERVNKSEKEKVEKKETLEKTFIKQREVKVVFEEDKIKDDIEKIDNIVNDSLRKLKKKPGRKKKSEEVND